MRNQNDYNEIHIIFNLYKPKKSPVFHLIFISFVIRYVSFHFGPSNLCKKSSSLFRKKSLSLPVSRHFDPIESFTSQLKSRWAAFKFNQNFWNVSVLLQQKLTSLYCESRNIFFIRTEQNIFVFGVLNYVSSLFVYLKKYFVYYKYVSWLTI